jgi:uncharacterized Fe-S center protein
MKSKVYYLKNVDSKKLVDMYKLVGKELIGNVAVKVHSGEDGNQNYLKPEFMKDLVEYVNGTIVETNTAYPETVRDTNEGHRKLLEKHGWSKYYNVDILDEEGEEELPVDNYKYIKNDLVGTHLKNYNSMLIISHFKGHPAAGFGGALKQLSIGCASRNGKALIHLGGITSDPVRCWDYFNNQNEFLESMAEAASAIVKYFKGNMVFINIMANMSVDCDCCATAEDPCMEDKGMLISLDPVAIDQACIDIVMNSNDPGKEHFMERVNSRNGIHTIEKAEELGIGSREYELIEL